MRRSIIPISSRSARTLGRCAWRSTGQIDFDFAGYSLIAIGIRKRSATSCRRTSTCPMPARSMTEFWRRRHISLSSRLRDCTSCSSRSAAIRTNYTRNLLLTMALGGLWHGASWNFRAGHAARHMLADRRQGVDHAWTEASKRACTADLTRGLRAAVLGAHSVVAQAGRTRLSFFSISVTPDAKTAPDVDITWHWLVLPLVVDALLQLRRASEKLEAKPLPAWAIGAAYAILFVLVLALGTWDSKAFIYFQF